MGATSLFAQTNYKVTFSANVEMDKIQVKNLNSGATKTLAKSDKVITLQKNAKQNGTAIESVDHDQFEFLQQTANNEVVVNMGKAGRLNLTLYSSNGTFVTRYANNVDAGPNAFQIGASSGTYVLVASANNQTASLKILLTQSTEPSILEVLTSKPEPILKSINDVITFDEGDEFEFTGYYYSQTKVETLHSAFITGGIQIRFSFTKVKAPTVTTVEATNVTINSATVGGNVTNDNGTSVTERGVCWATTKNPTVSDNKMASGTGTGSFTVTLPSLSEGTTYYVRAYAINNEGTSYGDEITFTTKKITKPTVTTVEVTDITLNSVSVVGNVSEDNGAEVTERGVCLSMISSPTVSNGKQTSGTGTGSFTVSFSRLRAGFTYYVRAYAINSKGISYGNEISFTAKDRIENGAVQAEFSVSDSKKVYFSQGNLQYQASTGTWRFAENQWDYVGTQELDMDSVKLGGTIEGSDNRKISPTYDGWIDWFAWGTSGWNSGANAYQPYSTSKESSDYYPGGDNTNNLTGSFANADWGVYNAISNGGNKAGMWRTLTKDEWTYLCAHRAQASNLMGVGKVNRVKGIILLPDDIDLSTLNMSGVKFSPVSLTTNYTTNVYWEETWKVMQSFGAVFLPNADCELYITGRWGGGNYWSSSSSPIYDGTYVYEVSTSQTGMAVTECQRYWRCSVRLVQDVE